jgi:coenzyme F420-reducing hydrogenase beta subunit
VPEECYAARGRNFEGIHNSSSGGISAILAETFTRNGKSVCGAVVADGRVVHRIIRAGENPAPLQGSKYVQSDAADAIDNAASLLERGIPVLFSGTPCQIAGLRKYLRRDYDNLIAVDFICHGVPSAKVLDKYLAELEQKQGSKVKSLNFRDKTHSWEELRLTVQFENGSTYSSPAGKYPYYRAFLCNLSLNKICGECPFNTLPRSADITLGDFWRITRHHEGFDGDTGVSCVVINTDKGRELFARVSDRLTAVPSTQADIMDGNPFLNGHCTLHKRRDKFMNRLDEKPLDLWAEECLKLTRLEWLREVLRHQLSKFK